MSGVTGDVDDVVCGTASHSVVQNTMTGGGIASGPYLGYKGI